MNLALLDALLIFLAGHKGLSGYDIRQLFQATPLGVFSDSPGSIYPSLARLEKRGLLTSTREASGRRRRSYARTAEGGKTLRAWLSRPIEDEAKLWPGEVELRFVMLAESLGWAQATRFLASIETLYAAKLNDLDRFMAGPGAAMSRASGAAVELGMRTYRLRIQWCRELQSRRGRTRS